MTHIVVPATKSNDKSVLQLYFGSQEKMGNKVRNHSKGVHLHLIEDLMEANANNFLCQYLL